MPAYGRFRLRRVKAHWGPYSGPEGQFGGYKGAQYGGMGYFVEEKVTEGLLWVKITGSYVFFNTCQAKRSVFREVPPCAYAARNVRK